MQLDDGLFDEGNKVEIQIGYVDGTPFEFWGEITAITPNFPESGLPTLTVRGFSYYHRLQRCRRSKAFKKIKDSDIAKKLADATKPTKLKAEVDDTGIEYRLVSAKDVTFASLLKQRAQRIGYEVVVKKDILYFQRPRYLVEHSPALTLEWGRDLRSFSPNLSTYNMVTEVKVRASQTSRGKGKDPLVGTASAGKEGFVMGDKAGSQIAKEIFGENSVLADDHNVTTQKEANDMAQAQLEAKSLGFISGRGSCIGNPQLVARQVINLKGLGKRFSGIYYVTSTTHTIDASGYRTDFEAKRNAR